MAEHLFTVEGFEMVSATTATVTLCGPLSEVQRLCPVGAKVTLSGSKDLDTSERDPLSDVRVDLVRQRVMIPMPISLSALSEEGAIYKLIDVVCGPGAIVDGRISGRLGAMCVCAYTASDAWLAELALQDWRSWARRAPGLDDALISILRVAGVTVADVLAERERITAARGMLRGQPVWTKLKAAYLSLSSQSNQQAQQDGASFASAVFRRVTEAAEVAADGVPPHV